jgi:hypothetical protein
MTQPQEAPQTEETPTTEQSGGGLESISAEQWQQFMGNMQAQNAALTEQLNMTKAQLANNTYASRREKLNQMSAEEKAEALQNELDTIRNTAQAAQAQEISNNVWQRRDADSAARILQLHNLSGNEPELYRANWDVNWMPRFVASVENVVKTKAASARAKSNPENNPANKANVSNTASAAPEIPDNLSGYDTIRLALARMRET